MRVSNQREFFRLNLSIPFSFTVVEASEEGVDAERRYTYHTKDLSGGGLGFETNLKLAAGDALRLNLLLPKSPPIKVDARVVWCREGTEEVPSEGGLEFVDIDEEEQDRIIGFLFRAQIEARKKSGKSRAG